jgi:hypothetical protein
MEDNLKALELAAFLGADTDQLAQSTLRTMTLRVPLADYAYIEAMASQSGLSRTAIGGKLISAGLVEVLNLIPADKLHVIEEITTAFLEQQES